MPGRPSSPSRSAVALALAALLVVGLGWLVFRPGGGRRAGSPQAGGGGRDGAARDRDRSTPSAMPPPPPPRATRFLNASTGVAYVGSERCGECHAEQFASFRRTAHSRALEQVRPETEPLGEAASGLEFRHPRSGRRYQAQWRDDTLVHSESAIAEQNAGGAGPESPTPVTWPPVELPSVELVVPYAIGSGEHSRSYLAEVDGFLVESPLTWYADRKEWGMSPGYDVTWHAGFSRMADTGCLTCHAGEIRARDGNRFRPEMHELVIGCERCHGPGELHAERRQGAASDAQRDAEDPTIVHPGRLARAAAEAVCAQCHLRGAATVVIRGRDTLDFRPGQVLDDFRVEYALDPPGEQVTLVGHVEQLRESACYREDERLGCATCHPPHARPDESGRVAHFRERCLSCHEDCGVDAATRTRQSPDDDCSSCHMPRRPTSVAHFAFTNHRIAVYRDVSAEPGGEGGPAGAAPGAASKLGELKPQGDVAWLSELDQRRCLGLGYLEVSEHQRDPGRRDAYRARALKMLDEVVEAGIEDAETLAALARLRWERDEVRTAIALARRALEQPALGGGAHANSLLILGESHLRLGEAELSRQSLERLVRLRRSADDWLLLGAARGHAGDGQGALVAFRQAARIDPFRDDVWLELAGAQAHVGDSAGAAESRQRAQAALQWLRGLATSPR